MIKEFREVNPNVQVFVCLPPPVFHSKFGITDSIVHYGVVPLVRAVGIASSSSLIDFYDNMSADGAFFFDGVHPDSTGDSIMAHIAYEAIEGSPSGMVRYFGTGGHEAGNQSAMTLYWETTNGSSVRINGSIVSGSDSMVVDPAKVKAYTLITSGAVADTCTITIK